MIRHCFVSHFCFQVSCKSCPSGWCIVFVVFVVFVNCFVSYDFFLSLSFFLKFVAHKVVSDRFVFSREMGLCKATFYPLKHNFECMHYCSIFLTIKAFCLLCLSIMRMLLHVLQSLVSLYMICLAV